MTRAENRSLFWLTAREIKLYFLYDGNGMPAMLYTSGKYYHYMTNSRGDVVAMFDTTGTELARYNYDAWGNCTVTTPTGAALTDATHIANINPLRYRGYYLDTDTGLYYCRDRYYDSVTHRFINADDEGTTTATPMGLTDKNLFSYCDNNPIMRQDDSGEFWNLVIGGVVGGIVGGVIAGVTSYVQTGEVDWGSVAVSTLSGAASGVIAATGLGWVTQACLTAGVSGAGTFLDEVRGKGFENVDWLKVGINAVVGGVSSAVGSGVGKLATQKMKAGADQLIKKGSARSARGQRRLDSGSRYGKGAKKVGNRLINEGKTKINYTRGVASVIGSGIGGFASAGAGMGYWYAT